jgi:hypothetical protein
MNHRLDDGGGFGRLIMVIGLKTGPNLIFWDCS